MNEKTKTNKANAATNFRPRLTYYHPNSRGTGCAVQFELYPAQGDMCGAIYATFARQKSVGSFINGTRVFPTFDWTNFICVRFSIDELSEMLQVFRGMQESIANGKGLFHRTNSSSTVIKLEHRIEPSPGYWLEVWKKWQEGEAFSTGILLSPTEALSLSLAIEQSMSVIAFGIPMVFSREAAAAI